jgi:hypothetical protein
MSIAELFAVKQEHRAQMFSFPRRGSGPSGRRKSHPRHRKFLLEPLEPPLLLSAEPLQFMPTAAMDLTVRLVEEASVPTIQLLDNTKGGAVVESRALGDTSKGVITGAEQDDKLTIDASMPSSLPVSFTDSSAGDRDKLELLGGDATSNITGPDTGTVGNVNFAGIENLTGAADNEDTFGFDAGGSLSGGLDGRDGGFDPIIDTTGGPKTFVGSALADVIRVADRGSSVDDAVVVSLSVTIPVLRLGPASGD